MLSGSTQKLKNVSRLANRFSCDPKTFMFGSTNCVTKDGQATFWTRQPQVSTLLSPVHLFIFIAHKVQHFQFPPLVDFRRHMQYLTLSRCPRHEKKVQEKVTFCAMCPWGNSSYSRNRFLTLPLRGENKQSRITGADRLLGLATNCCCATKLTTHPQVDRPTALAGEAGFLS